MKSEGEKDTIIDLIVKQCKIETHYELFSHLTITLYPSFTTSTVKILSQENQRSQKRAHAIFEGLTRRGLQQSNA